MTNIDQLVAEAHREIRRARSHTLPLDKIGLAIDLTDAAVCMDFALRGGDVLSIAGALARLRELNEGIAGGRAPARG